MNLEWHDAIRFVALLVNLYTLFVLIGRVRAGRHDWNSKTLDLWYTMSMWTAAGVVFCIQGIVLDRPFTVGYVFLTAASLVGGKGVHRKGPWGNPDA